jgi:hypothetical protein
MRVYEDLFIFDNEAGAFGPTPSGIPFVIWCRLLVRVP